MSDSDTYLQCPLCCPVFEHKQFIRILKSNHFMLLKEEPLKGPLKLTFSLATLCEKGQVPSVCLHVPRRNLSSKQDFNLKPSYKVLDVLYNLRVCTDTQYLVQTATLSGSWMQGQASPWLHLPNRLQYIQYCLAFCFFCLACRIIAKLFCTARLICIGKK